MFLFAEHRIVYSFFILLLWGQVEKIQNEIRNCLCNQDFSSSINYFRKKSGRIIHKKEKFMADK